MSARSGGEEDRRTGGARHSQRPRPRADEYDDQRLQRRGVTYRAREAFTSARLGVAAWTDEWRRPRSRWEERDAGV